MGKKMGGGGNTKVEAANAKKAAAQAAKDAKASAAAAAQEAAEWSKGSNARGAARKQEEERKRMEAEAKKAEVKRMQALEEATMDKLVDKAAVRKTAKAKKDVSRPWEDALKPVGKKASAKGSGSAGGKVTAAMIAAKKEEEAARAAKEAADRAKGIEFTTATTVNRNRATGVEGEARSLDAALDVLSLEEQEMQKHPEKRMKAAFKAFEEAMMPEMRADYPGLKLSQYKQRIFELWKKSPENPMNQASLAYNAKK